jgi:hypothetical protein
MINNNRFATFNESQKNFINNAIWTFAKTMPDWPHEYIVKRDVDENLFIETVRHIREFGYPGSFYQMPITYYEEQGQVYWTMGAAIEETIIINRCKKENTYAERLKNGTLPILKK